MKAWLVPLIAAIVVAGCSTPAVVDDIRCENMEGMAMHIHAHLGIYVNNKNVPVPADIGILKNCLYWLHTHDSSGIIHIESPAERTFTVGSFFDIWDKTHGSDPLQGETVVAYVNGQRYDGDFRSIAFDRHDSIVLEVNSTIPPQTYTFPPGL